MKGHVALSPRRRRLRVTLIALAGLAVFSLVAGLIIYLISRPEPYRPGEASADVTSELSRHLPADAPEPKFTDVTREAGLADFRNFPGSRTSQLPEDMGPGVAFGDFDNDGDDDVFLVSGGGALNLPSDRLLPCELYENLGNGAFRRFAGFPVTRIRGLGAAWGDYDGDGWLDLAVSGYNALLLFRNEPGEGQQRKFVREARFPGPDGFWAGVSWGDFDNDRDLDLYVCGYVQYVENESDRLRGSDQLGALVPYTLNPASYEPARNLLFCNNGDGTFREMGEELGVANPAGRSLGALWHDFDDDGWPDLYVANDISDNVLYHNTGGTFEDASHAAWVADYRSAMGLAAGDFDRDGDDDLFVDHWVAQENGLYQNLWADFNGRPETAENRRDGAGQSGFEDNTSTGHRSDTSARYALRFIDVADQKGLGQIALPFVGWGTEFFDFDGDGWLDLVVANGNTLEADGPGPRKLKPQEPFLFWNQRGQFFHNLAPLNKALSETHVSRGLAVSDFDNDGDMDILIANLGEGVQLLRNDTRTGHWLKLRLRSRCRDGRANGFGDGAKVMVQTGGAVMRRTVSSVSYLSQSSRTLHFGLGKATKIDRIEVRWPGGVASVFTNVDADATWVMVEGKPTPERCDAMASSRTGIKRADATNAPPLDSAGMATVAGKSRVLEPTDKHHVLEFWRTQREAMNALKVEKDIPKAARLFRAALELNPDHEDSRYYLAACLAAGEDWEGAMSQLRELLRINPMSHRGHSQLGLLRATSAKSRADLEAAEASLERAHAINPEETGALLVLGETALLRGDLNKADARLSAASRTNPKAAGGFFLRGYIAWKHGDPTRAVDHLRQAREALGKDWQPKGATSEGDVRQKHHLEQSPLTRFWQEWDGRDDVASAFAALEAHLKERFE